MGHRWCVPWLLAAAVLILAACAAPAPGARPDYVWTWVGEGPERDFRGAESRCRQQVDHMRRLETRAARDKADRQPPPDRMRQRPEFWNCMKAEGWVPEPAGADKTE